MKKEYAAVIFLIVIIAIVASRLDSLSRIARDFWGELGNNTNGSSIATFQECVAAGYPVVESYPRRCYVGTVALTEDPGDANVRDLNIEEHQVITSPLRLTGNVRGTWYFEASFPVRLYDEGRNEIAVAVAQAQGDWMTTEHVPFIATLSFKKPLTSTGYLVIQKDNPSGLPEHDASIEIPIRF